MVQFGLGESYCCFFFFCFLLLYCDPVKVQQMAVDFFFIALLAENLFYSFYFIVVGTSNFMSIAFKLIFELLLLLFVCFISIFV